MIDGRSMRPANQCVPQTLNSLMRFARRGRSRSRPPDLPNAIRQARAFAQPTTRRSSEHVGPARPTGRPARPDPTPSSLRRLGTLRVVG